MKKTGIWKRIILVNGLVSLLVVSVFAWFIMSNTASVNTLEEQVVEADYIRISRDGGVSWENGLDIDLGELGVVHEMSGDGLTLYEPVYGMYDIDSFLEADEQSCFIEEVFTFETDISQTVYLSNDSFVSPSDPTGNFSTVGDFSRDYIAGAIRVAFFSVDEEGEYTPIYIWAPNPTIEFSGTTVNVNGTVEEYYRYKTGPLESDTKSIPTEGAENGISDNGGFVWGDPEQDGVLPLISFVTENKVPVTGSVAMRVWLEGTDRECVSALCNGKFNMYFSFDTVGKE